MRFKLLLVLVTCLLASCERVSITERESFSAQLGELIQMRDCGTISEKEYRSQKHNIFSIMLH